MGVWDQIKRAKEAGQRVLEKYDGVEAEARANDPDRLARSLAAGSTETRLGGTGTDGELSDDLVMAGEIIIERDDGHDIFDVPSRYDAGDSLFSTEGLGNSDPDTELESMEQWQVAGRLFGDGFAAGDVTDGELELTEDGVVNGEGAATDPSVALLFAGELQDATANNDTTAHNVATIEFTDRTCELLPTDAGAGRNISGAALTREEIESHLLKGPFSSLTGVTINQMEQLSRFDAELLLQGETLGAAFLGMLAAYERADGSISESWESALWVTGVHWDAEVRENLTDLARLDCEEERKIALRCLAWSMFDDIEELLAAAGGVDDQFGAVSRFRAVVTTMDERWEFLGKSGLSDSEILGDDLPIEATGILALDGFDWGLLETK